MHAGAFTRNEHAHLQASSRASATVVMPVVLRTTGARSVVDIGCGTGAWLAVCAELGMTNYLGLDAASAEPLLQIPRSHFQPADLGRPLMLDTHYDLAMSLEVAEHLPPEAGVRLVKDLTQLAPQVLFSAAVPGQFGVGHINERWPSYWATVFATHGYRPVDAIRPQIWTRDQVAFWYRQNLMLFVRGDRLPENYQAPSMMDVVHPALYTNTLAKIDGTMRARLVKALRRLGLLAPR